MSEPFLTPAEVVRIIVTAQRMAARLGRTFMIDPAKLQAALKENSDER